MKREETGENSRELRTTTASTLGAVARRGTGSPLREPGKVQGEGCQEGGLEVAPKDVLDRHGVLVSLPGATLQVGREERRAIVEIISQDHREYYLALDEEQHIGNLHAEGRPPSQ